MIRADDRAVDFAHEEHFWIDFHLLGNVLVGIVVGVGQPARAPHLDDRFFIGQREWSNNSFHLRDHCSLARQRMSHW